MVRLTKATDALDSIRVLRRVSARRALRGLAMTGMVAVVGWLVLCAILKSGVASGSAARTRLTEEAVIGGLASVALTLLAAFGLYLTGRGPIGEVAARIRPVLRRTPEIRVDRTTVPPRPRLGVGAMIGAVVSGTATFYAAEVIVPSYRAAHGHGGPVVTIGTTARLLKIVVSDSTSLRRGPNVDYFLATTHGTAVTEGGGRPRTGDRYTLIDDLFGHQHAVLIGSQAWPGLSRCSRPCCSWPYSRLSPPS